MVQKGIVLFLKMLPVTASIFAMYSSQIIQIRYVQDTAENRDVILIVKT